MRHLLVLLLLMKPLEFTRQGTFELIILALFCVLVFVVHRLTPTVCEVTRRLWKWLTDQGTVLIGGKCSSLEPTEEPELEGLWDQQWLLQRVFSSLSSYDLLECSLVNRTFMKVSRKYLKSYRMRCPKALACLNERLALADSLTLHLGKTSTDLRLFTSLRLAEHLTSLSFDREGCSLGFKRSWKSECTILRRLAYCRRSNDKSEPFVLGINALSNLQFLKIGGQYKCLLSEAFQLSNLTSLDLTCGYISPKDLALLPSMKKLRCLRLAGVGFGQRTVFGSPLAELHQLTRLEIEDPECKPEFLEEVIPELKELKGLSLLITHSLRDLPYLEVMSGLSQLELLKLIVESELEADSLLFLAELSSLKSVKIKLPRKPRHDLFSHLKNLTCPLSLSLKLCNLVEMVQVTSKLCSLTQLTGLEVTWPDVLIDVDFFHNWQNQFALNVNPVTYGVELAPFLEGFPKLTNLKISVSSIIKLCNLLDFIGGISSLRKLTFVFSQPGELPDTKNGLKWLSNLTNLTSLTLDLPLVAWNCIRYIEIESLTSLEKLTLLSQCTDKVEVFPHRFVFGFPERLRWLRISSNLLLQSQEWELQYRFPSLRRITRM